MSVLSSEDNLSYWSTPDSGTPDASNPTTPEQTPRLSAPSYTKETFIETVLKAFESHDKMAVNDQSSSQKTDENAQTKAKDAQTKAKEEKKVERAAASLRAAAAGGFATLVELLLDKNRPPKPNSGKTGGLDEETYKTKFLNGKDKDGNTPLYHAAFVGHTNVLEILLEEPGIDLNVKNVRHWTPLRAALGTDNADAAELLAERKAVKEGNVEGVNGTKAYHKNWNPLCHAASAGHINVVRFLLERKEVVDEINEVDGDGMTALYLASANGHLRAVKLLLDKKADVNKESKGFLVPLYGAALGGHARVAQYFFSKRKLEIKRSLRNLDGDSPLDAAVKGGHTKVADILMDEIANAPDEDKSVDD